MEVTSALTCRFSILVELEFGVLVFVEGGKPVEPGENPSEEGREPITNSTHIWHQAGIEPGLHWWEASALSLYHPCSPKNRLLYTVSLKSPPASSL